MITRHSQPMFSIGRSIAPNLFSFKCYCHHKFADVVDLCLVVPYGTMEEWWSSNTWCPHVCHIQITIYYDFYAPVKVLLVHEIFPLSVFTSLVKRNWISLLPPSVCEASCFILLFFFTFFYCRNTHRDGGISTSEELTVDTSMVSLQANTYLGEYSC